MKVVKKKRFWFCILLILISVFYVHSKSQYTFKEENRIINYALKGKHRYKIKNISHNKEEKVITYTIYRTGTVNTQDYIDIYNRMNEYLKRHEKYFMHNKYRMSLEFVGHKAGGPGVVYFKNWNPYKVEDKDNLKDMLYCMEVLGETCYGFVVNDINGDMSLDGISAIIIDESIMVSKPYIFEFFHTLNYLRFRGTIANDIKSDLLQIIPNCEIIFNDKKQYSE